jgi:multidrug efflux pump subunit AcrA (membrane-fusion protein)
MKKQNLALTIVIVFAALIALAILVPKASKAPGGGSFGGKKGAAGGSTVFRVTSIAAERKDLHSYLETNGDVEADNTVEVFPDISGKLARLEVSLGSKVSKGQVLAMVDPSRPGSTYALSPVYAPISGTVTSLPLKAGATVSTGTVVGKIGDIDNLQVTALIAERDIAVLKVGLPAIITFEAYPGVEFSAKVFRVSPLVDSTSRTKTVYLSFDTEDPRINAGMYAKVKLYTTVSKNCITVPSDAVVNIYDKDYVYVINADSTVSRREVKKGVTVDGTCEIREGLAAGELVANEGVTVLSDGVTVKDISKKAGSEEAPSEGNGAKK